MHRTTIFLSSAALVTALPLGAQERRPPSEDLTLQEATQQFVQEKRAEQARYIQELRSQGISYGQVRSLVNQFRTAFRPNSRVAKTDLGAEINEIFLEDIAIELAILGFGPNDLRDDQQAKRLFDAAVNKRKDVATAEDLTLLAQDVVLGQAVEYSFPVATGPSPAFLVLRIVSVQKGDLSPGDVVRIPLASSRLGNNLFERDTSESLPPPGSSVKAYLSQSAASFSNRKGRKFAEPDIHQKISDLEITSK